MKQKLVGHGRSLILAWVLVALVTACSGNSKSSAGAEQDGPAGAGASESGASFGGSSLGGAPAMAGGFGGTQVGGRGEGSGGIAGAAPSAGAPGNGGGASGQSGGSAGSPNAGSPGAGSPSGGAPNCVAGAVCKCADRTGVTMCGPSGPSCVCPPAEQCQTVDDPKCFDPCGGDPFGGWVLEGACYAATQASGGVCDEFSHAAAGQSDVRLRILDGGELDLSVSEDWSVTSRISLSCSSLSSTNQCASAYYASNALLFGSMPRSTCTADACGACDCSGSSDPTVRVQSSYDYRYDWSRVDANHLALHLLTGSVTVPYCVQGNELWIGGSAADGSPRVAYKLKKQSCSGTPVACASRTPDNCEAGLDCTLGICTATGTTSPAHCSPATGPDDCGVLQGCVWNANRCFGNANPECAFETCGKEPGCTLGPPVEHCAGTPDCGGLAQADCEALGCSFNSCGPDTSNDVACAKLTTAADCAKAEGCVSKPGMPCTGQTECILQPDPATCVKLGCLDSGVASCAGYGTPCNQLSLADCDRLPGCRREW